MPRLNITLEQAIKIVPVIQAPNGSNRVIKIVVKEYKRLFEKGDRLFLYFRNYNKRLERLGVVECKKAELVEHKGQELTLRNTYDRRYYLNRRVKSSGFELELEQTSKTILVGPDQVGEAVKNKALGELGEKYNYGVQFTMGI
ncbi:MAG TPA: hypothetical protein DCL77_14430 [Prolixibacteraceae bacterium]|jgi:hypothetical protein|nr:hypothetical protein [Prolixibacteraceae bacterium]